jgi:hypothetical protein
MGFPTLLALSRGALGPESLAADTAPACELEPKGRRQTGQRKNHLRQFNR